MMNLTRPHMTIFSSAYKSQIMVKVKFMNSVKYQSVTIKMKQREYNILAVIRLMIIIIQVSHNHT